MMTDMIEKIARALADVDASPGWRKANPNEWKLYVREAKAALTALEQPSDEMIAAGEAENFAGDDSAFDFASANAFSAMIKAARGDQ